MVEIKDSGFKIQAERAESPKACSPGQAKRRPGE